MSLWGMQDQANNKPKYATNVVSSGLYDANDVYGVSVTETANSSGDVPHAGWLHVTRGVGPFTGVTINSGGTLYANGDALTFTGGGAKANGAAASVTTDANGTITSVTFSSYGTGYDDTVTIGVTSANGTGANLSPVLGGRAGRIFYETLVAASSISGDNTADNVFFQGT